MRPDQHFFDKMDSIVDLINQINAELPATSKVRNDPAYKEMLGYRKINHFSVVTSTNPANLIKLLRRIPLNDGQQPCLLGRRPDR